MELTAKEKAIELFDKMYSQRVIDLSAAKQCALIAVDEIIQLYWFTHKNERQYRYWSEVKQEINNL
jgi:hypothetical protein